MLLRVLRDIVSSRVKTNTQAGASNPLRKADEFAQQGDLRAAIVELRNYLDRFPKDILALNNLGSHLADIGDTQAACKLFELVYRLDDVFLPGVINYAKTLLDRRRSDEALPLLREARAKEPSRISGYIDAVCGGITFGRSDASSARRHALNAWLASFDNLRFANCYLMYGAYDDIDEMTLAAEHKFWGETLTPIELGTTDTDVDLPEYEPLTPKRTGTIRIGYWSPDFRNHSVRYFFRPLLDNHDHSRFEIFLYHDSPVSDAQTDEIRKSSDRFFDVSQVSDRKLTSFFKSHQLDVLVELAGHTSTNRLHLLQQRLATVQISGLGYPPTTGLSTIDAKIIDRHIDSPQSRYFYTEEPMVLANSFWCYDPYQNSPISSDPPAIRNGYITFACVGNIAKISLRILQCWKHILDHVPNSKLVIRSISFEDEAAMHECQKKIQASGISADRLLLLKPAGGADYFASYNEIDIILDTFPFNGGTTTCFATYMGVPVVSVAGKSLVSRMGKSVNANLGLSDWTVESHEAYVERAILASTDLESLRRFRAEARDKFQKTSLGNGKLFAQEFEAACVELLAKKSNGTWQRSSQVPDLPAGELMRRAYTLLSNGQEPAARRVVDYCLRAYPDFAPAHVLLTQEMTATGRFKEAAEYLLKRLDSFEATSKYAAVIDAIKNLLLSGNLVLAREATLYMQSDDLADATDAAQFRLLQSVLEASENSNITFHRSVAIDPPVSVSVFVVCDAADYPSICTKLLSTCDIPINIKVDLIHCPETQKGKFLNRAVYELQSDVVVWMHKNASVCNQAFFSDIITTLEHCDIVGFSGSASFDRLDWRRCEAPHRICSNLCPSELKTGTYELQVIGCEKTLIAGNMTILDGTLFAFSPPRLRSHNTFEFDPFLESATTLMEEHFIHQCHTAGLRLAAHMALGVMIDWRLQLLDDHLGEARWHLTQKMKFDPLAYLPEDRTIISAPVASMELGLKAQRLYFDGT